ncbi:MAG: Ig-like domain-containing protein, partial [Candidatus Thermoplasmatota archaeon]|nr:Ig-like domain-containing protein [Candidatus Thermoplasmatota archaeon]
SVGAEDLAGNQVTTGFNVHIDLDPPVVRILEPTDGSFHNSSTISIELDGSDTGTGIRGYTIKVDDGDQAEIGLVTEHIMENLTDGEHEISAAALDGGGLISYSNISIIIDTLPPEISITSPVNRDHLSSNRIFMEWDAVDQLSGIAYMAYSLNNITWTRIPKDSKNTTVRTGTGEQTISLKAVDRAGNQKIIYRIITIDTYGPRISDFGPKEDLVEPDTTIWIIFNEEMDDKSISIIVGGVSGQIHGSGAKFFLEPDLKLAPGTIYNVNVSGRDLAGNPSISFLWEFTVKDTLILFGTVYDENGEPLAGARMILQSGRTTETDADGRFNITARIGESSLEVVKYGYVKQKVELNHTSTENLLVPNIYLQKEEMSIKSGLPAHMKDPFTYIVLVLV